MNHAGTASESDPFHLERFVEAQEDVYDRALAELKRGIKESHWMWFIFPQMRGLGKSSTAQFYGIKNIAEAKAYLEHPLLGQRLVECSNALLHHKEKSALQILGFPDNLKLHSSMTLFACVEDSHPVFAQVIGQYFAGELDPQTVTLLKP